MAEAQLVFTLDTRLAKAQFRRASAKTNPGFISRQWRRFMQAETGGLKRKLAVLISREGPIGVNRWWRKRITWTVVGGGVAMEGTVQHDNVPYKEVIEFGRSPGSIPPPREELLPWMRAKGMLREFGGDTDDEQLAAGRLAFVIGMRGTFQPGDPVLEGSAGPGMQQYARTMAANRELIAQRGLDLLFKLANEAFGGSS